MDGWSLRLHFELGNLQHSNLDLSYCVRVVAKKGGRLMVGDLLWKIWLTRKIRSKTKYYIHTSEQRRFLIRWPSGNPVGCLLAASTSTMMHFVQLLSNLVSCRYIVSKTYLFLSRNCHVKFSFDICHPNLFAYQM